MISFNVLLGVIFVLFILSIIAPLKNKENVVIMHKDCTLTLRGIAILGIVLHHCTNIYSDLGPFWFWIKQSGYALTAIFFLFSGYGCWYSLRKISVDNNKNSVTAKWAINHSLRLWLDFVIVFVINVLLFMAFKVTDGMTAKELVKDFFTVTQPTWVSWYPKIQIACYVVLAISFMISPKGKEWICLGVTVAYILVMWKLGMASMWYSSVICFPIGLLFAKYREKINLNKVKSLVLMIPFAVIFFGLYYLQTIMYTEIFRTISSVFLAVFVISFTGLFNLKNKFLMTVGNMSFEVYLIHLCFVRIAQVHGYNPNIAIPVIVILTVLLSYPINNLVVNLNGKIKNKYL